MHYPRELTDCVIPVFEYSSAFTYKRKIDVDDVYHQMQNDLDSVEQKSTSFSQKIVHTTLVVMAGFFLLFTFPVTAFFSFKKVNSLQRCLIYRLGTRLPTKGPGIVMTLPFIDQACLVDLTDITVNVIEAGQQILTGLFC